MPLYHEYSDLITKGEKSFGDYSAENDNSSAVGKYQFLWNTWGQPIMEFARKHGIHVGSKEDFKADAELQEMWFSHYVENIAKPHISRLKTAYGDAGLNDKEFFAAYHFAGPGNLSKALRGELAWDVNPTAHLGIENTSINEYIRRSTGKSPATTMQPTRPQGLTYVSKDIEPQPLPNTLGDIEAQLKTPQYIRTPERADDGFGNVVSSVFGELGIGGGRTPVQPTQYQPGGQYSFTDSIRHQGDKTIQYEILRGDRYGQPLTQYKDNYDQYMGNYMDIANNLTGYGSAMNVARVTDWVFNSGIKNPKNYIIGEYNRKYNYNPDDFGEEDKGWNYRKTLTNQEADKIYKEKISQLTEDEQAKLINLARDWYYKNTYLEQDGMWYGKDQQGVPIRDKYGARSPAYKNTWYGRIHNVDTFEDFNPNNPKFTPKQDGGGITTEDSLVLFMNALEKNNFYENNPNYSWKYIEGKTPDVRNLSDKVEKYANRYNSDAEANFYTKSYISESGHTVPPGKMGSGTRDHRFWRKGNITSLGDIWDKYPDPWYNTNAPNILIHPNIKPNYWKEYEYNKISDRSEVPVYMPIAVWPRSMGPMPNKPSDELINWYKNWLDSTPESQVDKFKYLNIPAETDSVLLNTTPKLDTLLTNSQDYRRKNWAYTRSLLDSSLTGQSVFRHPQSGRLFWKTADGQVKIIDENQFEQLKLRHKKQDGGIFDEVTARFPALKAMQGKVNFDQVEGFADSTGVGGIEYVGGKEVNYPNDYTYTNPYDSPTIVYDPKTNDAQSIALDMLHGFGDYDTNYKNLRDSFKKTMIGYDRGSLEQDIERARAEGNQDPEEQLTDNWVDGKIRALLFEGSPEDFKKHRYNPKEREQYLSDPDLKQSFGQLEDYLKTMQTPQGGRTMEQMTQGQDGGLVRLDVPQYQDAGEFEPMPINAPDYLSQESNEEYYRRLDEIARQGAYQDQYAIQDATEAYVPVHTPVAADDPNYVPEKTYWTEDLPTVTQQNPNLFGMAFTLPQVGLTNLFTLGRHNFPGEALGLKGGWRNLANFSLDPWNAAGAGATAKGISLPQKLSRVGKAMLPFGGAEINIGKKLASTRTELANKARHIQKNIPEYTSGVNRGVNDWFGNPNQAGERTREARPFFEAFPVTKSQKAKVVAKQDKAWESAANFGEKWAYKNNEIAPDVLNKIQNMYYPQGSMSGFDPITGLKSHSTRTPSEMGDMLFNPIFHSRYASNNPFTRTEDILTTTHKKSNIANDVLEQRVQDSRSNSLGVNYSSDPVDPQSITFRNQGFYYVRPEDAARTGSHEGGHTYQNLLDWGELTTKWDSNVHSYYYPNPDTEIGKAFDELMDVKLAPGEEVRSHKSWLASPNEVHSDLMSARQKKFEKLKVEGQRISNPEYTSKDMYIPREGSKYKRKPRWVQEKFKSDEDIIEYIKELEQNSPKKIFDEYFKSIPRLESFWKKDVDKKDIYKLLQKLPAVAPVGVGVGMAAQSNNKSQLQDGGLVRLDEVPQYQEGSLITHTSINPQEAVADNTRTNIGTYGRIVNPNEKLSLTESELQDHQDYLGYIKSDKYAERAGYGKYNPMSWIKPHNQARRANTVPISFYHEPDFSGSVRSEMGNPLNFYNPFGKYFLTGPISMHLDPQRGQSTYLHELAHASTIGNERLPSKKKINEIIGESTGNDNISNLRDTYGESFDVDYFRNPTEVHARINATRKYLKDTGKHKVFGEDISDEQLDEMWEKRENVDYWLNQDRQNVWDLLNVVDTKEQFKRLMNEVAYNEATIDNRQFAEQGGSIPVSSRGLWDFPRQNVIVPTSTGKITMKGKNDEEEIDYPVLGIDEDGNSQLMQPGGEYAFKPGNVLEIPMIQDGAEFNPYTMEVDTRQGNWNTPKIVNVYPDIQAYLSPNQQPVQIPQEIQDELVRLGEDISPRQVEEIINLSSDQQPVQIPQEIQDELVRLDVSPEETRQIQEQVNISPNQQHVGLPATLDRGELIDQTPHRMVQIPQTNMGDLSSQYQKALRSIQEMAHLQPEQEPIQPPQNQFDNKLSLSKGTLIIPSQEIQIKGASSDPTKSGWGEDETCFTDKCAEASNKSIQQGRNTWLDVDKVGAIGNAWQVLDNVIDYGGEEIYSFFKENKEEIDGRLKGLTNDSQITKEIQDIIGEYNEEPNIGIYEPLELDQVALFYPGSDFHADAFKEGFLDDDGKIKDNGAFNTHLGHIVYRNGVPHVWHNIDGDIKIEPLQDIIDGRVKADKKGNILRIARIARPNFLANPEKRAKAQKEEEFVDYWRNPKTRNKFNTIKNSQSKIANYLKNKGFEFTKDDYSADGKTVKWTPIKQKLSEYLSATNNTFDDVYNFVIGNTTEFKQGGEMPQYQEGNLVRLDQKEPTITLKEQYDYPLPAQRDNYLSTGAKAVEDIVSTIDNELNTNPIYKDMSDEYKAFIGAVTFALTGQESSFAQHKKTTLKNPKQKSPVRFAKDKKDNVLRPILKNNFADDNLRQIAHNVIRSGIQGQPDKSVTRGIYQISPETLKKHGITDYNVKDLYDPVASTKIAMQMVLNHDKQMREGETAQEYENLTYPDKLGLNMFLWNRGIGNDKAVEKGEGVAYNKKGGLDNIESRMHDWNFYHNANRWVLGALNLPEDFKHNLEWEYNDLLSKRYDARSEAKELGMTIE